MKNLIIKRSSMCISELKILDIAKNKMGLLNAKHVADLKYYFGVEDDNSNKLLIYIYNSCKTFWAEEIIILKSGLIKLVNPKNEKGKVMFYSKDLKFHTDIHDFISIEKNLIMGKNWRGGNKLYNLDCVKIKSN